MVNGRTPVMPPRIFRVVTTLDDRIGLPESDVEAVQVQEPRVRRTWDSRTSLLPLPRPPSAGEQAVDMGRVLRTPPRLPQRRLLEEDETLSELTSSPGIGKALAAPTTLPVPPSPLMQRPEAGPGVSGAWWQLPLLTVLGMAAASLLTVRVYQLHAEAPVAQTAAAAAASRAPEASPPMQVPLVRVEDLPVVMAGPANLGGSTSEAGFGNMPGETRRHGRP